MSVSLLGWGRFFNADGHRITVPAPSTEKGARWLWDLLAEEASGLSAAGFNAIQLPPASKAQGGAAAGCDGYGVYDPRDLGTKAQQGSTPTRYGTAEQLRRLVAVAHAHGLAISLDLVLHQLIGGDSANYRYLGADGETPNGRGAMHPGCFRLQPGGGTQRQDDVPAPGDDFAFGDEKVYQNAEPARYTIEDALDYGDWLFRTVGADAGRIDDVKGLWAPFVAEFLSRNALAAKPFYSEYFDGDRAKLNDWVGAPLDGRSGMADFPLHFALQAACNGLDARALDGAGYANWNPSLAYTFVDNPDTDTSPGQGVVSSKLLAYAYALTTASRQVLVYAKDYFPPSVWPGSYGLKPFIDNLIYIHQTFAYGAQSTRWVDDKVIVIERDGQGGVVGSSPGLLTALNFDTYNRRVIQCATSFGANVHLHDYTGRHDDVWTDADGALTFTLPANAYTGGQSYLCFSRAGADRLLTQTPRETTQTFFGAEDLDIAPAQPGRPRAIARIYVDGGSVVSLSHAASIMAIVLDEDKAPVPENRATQTGWYTLAVSAAGEATVPFELTVRYRGPKTID